MPTYDYGIIGNCTSAALVSSSGSIDWLCLPIFDSPSVFGKILDKEKGGHFKIIGVNALKTTQDYIPHTAILKTVIETREGAFEINDYMPRFIMPRGEYYCPPEIHRNVRVLSGKPRIRVELAAKPNYALGDAECFLKDDYLKICSTKGDYNSYYFYSNVDYQSILDGLEIELKKYTYFVLSYHEKLEPITTDKIYVEFEKTKVYWLDWVERTHYPERFKESVRRSAITLKLLMYQRSGAVVAAITTSLPEIIGKDRNWDYRYCWIRDASMIIDLYARIGHIQSAEGYIDFILNRMKLKHENIGVMYGINGEEDLVETTLDHLRGYEDSRPVRIGNDAYRQQQNDLYGQLIETIYTYFFVNRRRSLQVDEEVWTMVRSLVNRVKIIWQQPDSGIWERRGPPRHYVHSKLMNWVAMDRAVKIATMLKKDSHAAGWRALADEIKGEILDRGWSERMHCFVMYYDSDVCDAANLLMLHYGFLERDDPKIIATVETCYKKLVRNGFTFRYVDEDEFGTPENAFIVCSFWMINALYLIGREKLARELFENIVQCANHLGLYSEDIEVTSRRLTGNFPQGYSHMAFIQTALLLETDYNWSDVSDSGRH